MEEGDDTADKAGVFALAVRAERLAAAAADAVIVDVVAKRRHRLGACFAAARANDRTRALFRAGRLLENGSLLPFVEMQRGRGIQLDLHPMKVSADPGQLEHALTNLLTNALKYARTEIRISCGGGLICIENDCDSLTDDVVQHLFERFYTGPDGNTGIGLSLAKDYLTLHGWTITAVRTENGIRFEIKCN